MTAARGTLNILVVLYTPCVACDRELWERILENSFPGPCLTKSWIWRQSIVIGQGDKAQIKNWLCDTKDQLINKITWRQGHRGKDMVQILVVSIVIVGVSSQSASGLTRNIQIFLFSSINIQHLYIVKTTHKSSYYFDFCNHFFTSTTVHAYSTSCDACSVHTFSI